MVSALVSSSSQALRARDSAANFEIVRLVSGEPVIVSSPSCVCLALP